VPTISTPRRRPAASELGAILDERAIRSVYQPIVAIDSGETIGYEALARGPIGSSLERPDMLFAAAREESRLADLDWACRAAAVRGALDGGLRPPHALFVNVERSPTGPPTCSPRCPASASWATRSRSTTSAPIRARSR
jgi:EAL domain-containing protein (putative c-di-GMP-specific phosphodiesterase class I)